MAGTAVAFDVHEIGGLSRRLAGLALDAGEQRTLLTNLGVELEAQIVERFDTKKAPDGSPWEALSERYAEYLSAKFPGARPQLVVSGSLRDTVESQPKDWEVLAGATKIYAARHNFGYEDVTPARPFIGISAENEEDLERIVDETLKDDIAEAAK